MRKPIWWTLKIPKSSTSTVLRKKLSLSNPWWLSALLHITRVTPVTILATFLNGSKRIFETSLNLQVCSSQCSAWATPHMSSTTRWVISSTRALRHLVPTESTRQALETLRLSQRRKTSTSGKRTSGATFSITSPSLRPRRKRRKLWLRESLH